MSGRKKATLSYTKGYGFFNPLEGNTYIGTMIKVQRFFSYVEDDDAPVLKPQLAN